MQETITQGRTVAEAVEKACSELGLSSDDLVYEILEEAKSGVFGIGARPARVRAWRREDEISAKSLLEELEHPAREKESRSESEVGERTEPHRTERHREEARAGKKHTRESKPEKAPKRDAELRESYPFNTAKEERAPEEAKAPAPPAAEAPQQAPETAETIELAELPESAKTALEFLKEVGARLGVASWELSAQKTERGIKLVAEGADASALIGRHGELMDALQYLCTLVSSRAGDDYCKISLDIAGYRKKRERALQALASREAGKVKRTKYSATLEPMNPYERRIVHSAVQQIEGVISESVGEEPYRRVVISLESGGKGSRRPDRKRGGPRRPRTGGRPERRAPRDYGSRDEERAEPSRAGESPEPARSEAEKKTDLDESLLYKKIEL
ncbi:MAG: RNA-binding cell elongation regulator Jag/EloR [Oscillospiraceae bacterium]|nr:RNA-binding cell elongation regulator Jag/EloR [Oscillospiraceae bacterium]